MTFDHFILVTRLSRCTGTLCTSAPNVLPFCRTLLKCWGRDCKSGSTVILHPEQPNPFRNAYQPIAYIETVLR